MFIQRPPLFLPRLPYSVGAIRVEISKELDECAQMNEKERWGRNGLDIAMGRILEYKRRHMLASKERQIMPLIHKKEGTSKINWKHGWGAKYGQIEDIE